MKPKVLLFSLLIFYGALNAQDTIKTLVISECRIDDVREAYVEFTNMGSDPIDLSEFEFGRIGAWTSAKIDSMVPDANSWFMLPNVMLGAGESFVIAIAFDWQPEQWLKDPTEYWRSGTKNELWWLADILLHYPEAPVADPTDSITPGYQALETWNGRDCLYLRHHLSNGDSVLIDQVNGLFTDADGSNPDAGRTDVAGFTDATFDATLVRRFSVKEGNLDFENARGEDLGESEWIPIPHQLGHWEVSYDYRRQYWTTGNHGNYVLDENTLESTTVDVDFAQGILTVPWGVRNDDSIMSEFTWKPGIAWHYDYAPSFEDSAFNSCRTGDTLTLYVCGDTLGMKKFRIEVAPPTTDANIVVPKYVPNDEGFYDGAGIFCWISDESTVDTIFEIPYALRVDTLYKYLEFPANVKDKEIIWVDGQTRTDLKMGDLLRVTAENDDVKDYYIKPSPFYASHNARLSMITWPDIPEFYKGLFGWVGDTIPGFNPTNYDYTVQVPFDVEGIPALVAKTQDLNATVEVERAVSLSGSAAARTVTFTTTAEDDTLDLVYKVELQKEQDPGNIQHWDGEPFISQFVYRDQWANNFIEIVNPSVGIEPKDFSDYMIYCGPHDNQADAIRAYGEAGDTLSKYRKYIPGYRWLRNADWAIDPGKLMTEPDATVNKLVYPGDVFVIAQIRSIGQSGYPWYASEQADLILCSLVEQARTPWDEIPNAGDAQSLDLWHSDGIHYYLWKILNDSIKEGTKAATDPNDFKLLEAWGDPGNASPVINGRTIDQINCYVRKPQYYMGDTVLSSSFGTDDATSQWNFTNRDYYIAAGLGWPADILAINTGIGTHFMYEVTIYQSKVNSTTYKVSPGYSMNEEIRGVVEGTTVTQFLTNIIKKDDGQTLTLRSATTGADLAADDVLADGDTLIVLSAEYDNVSKYILSVTAGGLSDDAVLTSATYTINVNGSTGTVEGFDYGTALKTVVENVTVPLGAEMNIINDMDAYQPLKMLNFDTVYVDVMVSDQVYFEVIAEDGATKILYQLKPTALASDAFVTSSVFDVVQDIASIDYVPEGISVFGFLQNLVPSPGATMQLIDKYGFDRNIGSVVKDDKLVVTASDGVTTKTYTLTMLGELDFLAYVTSDVYSIDQLLFNISGDITELTMINDFVANLVPAKKASIKVVDASGNAKTGELNNGDKLVVTSSNGLNIVEYTIDITYLAYVTSTVYTVNATTLNISGDIRESTTVSAFLGNLVASEGATIKVVDSQGADKTGNMSPGDKLVVTAGDGVTTAEYTIEVAPTSVNDLSVKAVDIYPNPSSGKVNISGLALGNRIQVFNIIGDQLLDITARHSTEIISLEDQPDGVYIIRLSDEEEVIGHYRLILE